MDSVPYPLREKPKTGLATSFIAYLGIEALRATGRSSKVVYQGERPLLPYRVKNFELSEVEDELDLPLEMQRRINILRYNEIPIKQVLIVHELPPVKELPAPKETPPVRPPDAPKTVEKEKKVPILTSDDLTTIVRTAVTTVTIFSLVVGALLALAAFIVFLPTLIGLVSAAILPIVLIGGLLLGCGTDPICIVVLDDEKETWLEIGFWLE